MPRSRQAVLAATLLQPTRSWYLSELARHLHVRPSTLQRELSALTAAGILKSHRQGRMIYFQADSKSPIYPELHGLLLKTSGLADVLRSALAPVIGDLKTAFIYGSVARAQEHSLSDVDLMVVGDIELMQVASALRGATDRLGREINPKIYRPEEFMRKLARNDHFLQSVLKSPKIFIYGTEGELEQLTESKSRGLGANDQGGD